MTLNEVDYDKLSPMMQLYVNTKKSTVTVFFFIVSEIFMNSFLMMHI